MVGKGISFNPDADIPSLAGKVILITGGNNGLGKQAAREFAKHDPAEIWIAARNAAKGNATVDEIKAETPAANVRFLELDLSSFASIKSAVKTFLASTSRLDILMLNAGVMGGPHGVTKEGYESRFGTNHMGHALLVKLLTPLLLKTVSEKPPSDVRVIVLGSEGHKSGLKDIAFDDLKTKCEKISPTYLYCMSKLANLLYARELAKHYPQFLSISIDPGNVKTDLFEPNGAGLFIRFLGTVVLPILGVPVQEGAKNQLWGSVTKDAKPGEYYRPVAVAGDAHPVAMNDELAKKLWDWTEKELEGQDL